jgi:hypothetical protein
LATTVNHDPQLSDNGSDLEQNGLTWLGDQNDSRLDFTKVFYDPDVIYANDSLNFSWSGQGKITVKDNRGQITLTPTMYWHGNETIKFKAVDRFGRAIVLWLDCMVLPVNHAPRFCETEMDITWDSYQALVIKEAESPASENNLLILSISVFEPDRVYGSDYNQVTWYVNDSKGKNIYKTPKVGQDMTLDFRCDFKKVEANAYSASGSPYKVQAVVRDRGGLSAMYTWNVTVLDMNRPPIARYDSPLNDKSFTKGETVYFDGWNSYDPDEDTDKLSFTWSFDEEGIIHSGRGEDGARFSINELKTGMHSIKLVVTDSDGAQDIRWFSIQIVEPVQKFNQIDRTSAVLATILLIVSISGLAYARARRRTAPRPADTPQWVESPVLPERRPEIPPLQPPLPVALEPLPLAAQTPAVPMPEPPPIPTSGFRWAEAPPSEEDWPADSLARPECPPAVPNDQTPTPAALEPEPPQIPGPETAVGPEPPAIPPAEPGPEEAPPVPQTIFCQNCGHEVPVGPTCAKCGEPMR